MTSASTAAANNPQLPAPLNQPHPKTQADWQQILNQLSSWQNALQTLIPPHQQTAAEIAAGVTPTNYAYAALDCRRYGADSTGSADSTAAFNSLLSVILALGGASVTVSPGTYKITSTVTANLAPNSGPTAVTNGISLDLRGVTINYTGTGYCFDFFATNTAATFGFPMFAVQGGNVLGSSAASGGFRTRSLNTCRWINTKVQGFTTGPAWTVLNDANWSENCHWRGCAAVNCMEIIAFQKTSGTNSFARTYVDGMFGAGITAYWFDIAGGCSVYDSRFTHISGNFTSLGLFAIGTSPGSAADMSASVVDGVDTEYNGAVSITWTGALLAGATSATLNAPWPFASGTYTIIFSDAETRQGTFTENATSVTWSSGLSGGVTTAATIQQGLFVLRDYPQNAGVARRPVIYNVGSFATNGGTMPLWLTGAGAQATLEAAQTQPLSSLTTLSSYEPNFGLQQVLAVPTNDSNIVGSITLTGFTSPPSGRIAVYRNGSFACIKIYDNLGGTSNANTMTLTTLPAEFRPPDTRSGPCIVQDNGNQLVPAIFSVAANGVVTFAIAVANGTYGSVYSTTGFTASGAKGINAGTVLEYPLS